MQRRCSCNHSRTNIPAPSPEFCVFLFLSVFFSFFQLSCFFYFYFSSSFLACVFSCFPFSFVSFVFTCAHDSNLWSAMARMELVSFVDSKEDATTKQDKARSLDVQHCMINICADWACASAIYTCGRPRRGFSIVT